MTHLYELCPHRIREEVKALEAQELNYSTDTWYLKNSFGYLYKLLSENPSLTTPEVVKWIFEQQYNRTQAPAKPNLKEAQRSKGQKLSKNRENGKGTHNRQVAHENRQVAQKNRRAAEKK